MGSLSSQEKTITGWAAKDPSGILSPYVFTLRETGPDDVHLRVLYCGICHTDIHQIKNHLGMSNYPMVPGHEVVGEVMEVGTNVSKFAVGDIVGAGTIVGCCRSCNACKSNIEQYYRFVVRIPENLSPEQAAPLLCAGVTVYSPLKHFGLMQSGLRGGILGLGGVGHMGVKIAKAMGHHVTVISSSERKKEEAIDHLGADAYLVSSEMADATDSFDYIIDTIPVFHPLEPYLALLKLDAKLILMGVINEPLNFVNPLLMLGRKTITGSFIGSMDETQEVLEFCVENGLTSKIELVKMDYINRAMERLETNDVRYRFVVDVAGSNPHA